MGDACNRELGIKNGFLAPPAASAWRAAAAEAAAGESTPLLLALEGRELIRSRPRRLASRQNAGHNLIGGFQVAFDQLGVLAVADAEPDADRLQLLVQVLPHRSA